MTSDTTTSATADSRPKRTLLRRPRRRWTSVLALLAVIGLGLLAAGSIFPALSPFHAQTEQSTTVPLLVQVRSLSQYKAATGTFQTLVEVDHSTTNVPSIISGEHTTLFATGTVDALVDFTRVGPDRVVLAPDGESATITLPAPVLTQAVVDPAQSRVVGRERGIVQRLGDAVSNAAPDDRDLYALAGQKLTAAAQGSDLVTRAEDSTRTMLTTLAGSLGVPHVTVVFDPADHR